jgi:signal transduction histidine kinase
MRARALGRLRARLLAPARLLRRLAARWLPRRTVRLRLTLLYGSLFLLAGAALLAITYTLDASTLSTATVTAKATSDGHQVLVQVSSSGNGPPLALLGSRPDHPGTPSGVARSGVIPSGPAAISVPAGNVAFQAGNTAKASPVGLPAGVTVNPGVFVKEALDRQRSSELAQLLLWSGAALAIMALVSVGLGWWIAGRVLAPLRRMTASARQISAENLYERLALDGPDDELKELGDTFDGLLTRLEGAFEAQQSAFEAQRRFVANASHELRTPLTVQRAMMEVALADPDADAGSLRVAFARAIAAGEQQEHLIEALLTLARSERGLDRREAVDLAAEVRLAMAAVGEVRPAGHDRGTRGPRITLDLRPAALAGDRQLVERLAVNLLDNAARHNAPDGWVHVTTETAQKRATLRVVNSGPVLAPDDVPALLEPFRDAAPARAGRRHGHGLGLSIAAAIATAHGADLRVDARPEGGLEIEVSFPAIPIAAPAVAKVAPGARPDAPAASAVRSRLRA